MDAGDQCMATRTPLIWGNGELEEWRPENPCLGAGSPDVELPR